MQIASDGIVIRVQNVGESDRLVTILTRRCGIVRAFAKGAKNIKSRLHAPTQLLCYGDFVLYQGRDKFVVDHADSRELFYPVRTDVCSMSLSQYFCELFMVLSPKEELGEDYLRLLLNALAFLASGKRPPLQIKAVLEMRLSALIGYMPDLVGCAVCGEYMAAETWFFYEKGEIACKECAGGDASPSLLLPAGVVAALRHTIYAPFDKLFAFALEERQLPLFAQAAERFLLSHTDYDYKTLAFYKQITEGFSS